MLDYTKLLKKINPDSDGEDTLRLRVGVVSTVNSDGTVNVTISGVTIPNVPRLLDSSMATGAAVQVLSYRGSLLVLGRVSTGNPSRVVGAVNITPTANTPSSQTVTYPSLGGTGAICGQTTANSAVPGSQVTETSISSLGATSSIVWIYRTNTTTTTIFYTIERAT